MFIFLWILITILTLCQKNTVSHRRINCHLLIYLCPSFNQTNVYCIQRKSLLYQRRWLYMQMCISYRTIERTQWHQGVRIDSHFYFCVDSILTPWWHILWSGHVDPPTPTLQLSELKTLAHQRRFHFCCSKMLFFFLLHR